VLSEAKVYVDGVGFSIRRRGTLWVALENGKGRWGGRLFIAKYSAGVGSVLLNGTVLVTLGCGHVVGRPVSTESINLLDVAPLLLITGAFGGGNGSFGEYSGSGGDLGGVEYGELTLVDGVLEEPPLELLVDPFRAFLGRTMASWVCFELPEVLTDTRVTVGPCERCLELLRFFFSGSVFDSDLRCNCSCDWFSRRYNWFKLSTASRLDISDRLVSDL
jgi:hypothetical protein